MNTLNGYSKSTLTNSSVLAAGGGDIPLGNTGGNVIPLNNGTTNVGLVAEKAVKDKNGSDIVNTYLPKAGGTTTGLIVLGANNYEKTIQWANTDFKDATAKAFMGVSGDWIVRSKYKVEDTNGKKYTEEGWIPTYETADLRFNRNSLKVGGADVITSSNYTNYLGYIGKTAVQSSSAAQSLEGIVNIIPDASDNNTNYDLGNTSKIWSNLYVNNVHVNNNINLRNGLYWVSSSAEDRDNPYKQILGKEGSRFKVGKDMTDFGLDLIGSYVTLYATNNAVLTARSNYVNIKTSGYQGYNLQVEGGKVMADGYYLWPNDKTTGYMVMTNGTSMPISNLLTDFSGGDISSSGNTITLSQKSITVGGTTKTIDASDASIINSLTLSSSSSDATNLSLTVNVNGVSEVTNITDLYAYKANELRSHNTRSVNNTPSTFGAGARFEFKSNTTDGLDDGGTYHGILHFRPYGNNSDFSGGGVYQLGFTHNGNLWFRDTTVTNASSNGSATWNAWKQLAFQEDVPNVTDAYWANVKVSDTPSTTTTPTFGTTSVLGLKITNETNAKHIAFSRGSGTDFPYNYISAPTGGVICILPNGANNDSSSGIQFSSSGIHPATSNAYSLGTSDKLWNKLFVTEGNFSGNINIAVNHGIYQYSGGTAKEALFLGSDRFELGKGLTDKTLWLHALDFKFNTSALSQAFIITSNGGVGIGDVGGAPAEKLHVSSGSVLADNFKAWEGGLIIFGNNRSITASKLVKDGDYTKLEVGTTSGEASGKLLISGIGGSALNLFEVKGHILPKDNNTYNLGSSHYFWNSLHAGYGLHILKSTDERWSILRADNDDGISRLHFQYYGSGYNSNNPVNVIYLDRTMCNVAIPMNIKAFGGSQIDALVSASKSSINIMDTTNSSNYHSWIRQKTPSTYVSQGMLGSSMYFISSQAGDSVDSTFQMDFSTNTFTSKYLKGSLLTDSTTSTISSYIYNNKNTMAKDRLLWISNSSTSTDKTHHLGYVTTNSENKSYGGFFALNPDKFSYIGIKEGTPTTHTVITDQNLDSYLYTEDRPGVIFAGTIFRRNVRADSAPGVGAWEFGSKAGPAANILYFGSEIGKDQIDYTPGTRFAFNIPGYIIQTIICQLVAISKYNRSGTTTDNITDDDSNCVYTAKNIVNKSRSELSGNYGIGEFFTYASNQQTVGGIGYIMRGVTGTQDDINFDSMGFKDSTWTNICGFELIVIGYKL